MDKFSVTVRFDAVFCSGIEIVVYVPENGNEAVICHHVEHYLKAFGGICVLCTCDKAFTIVN